MWNKRFEELCLLIFPAAVVVDEDFKLLPIVVLEESMGEKGDRMMEEIWRNIADSQTLVWHLLAQPISIRCSQLTSEIGRAHV